MEFVTGQPVKIIFNCEEAADGGIKLEDFYHAVYQTKHLGDKYPHEVIVFYKNGHCERVPLQDCEILPIDENFTVEDFL
jgi:hypothetical protein